MNGWVIAIYVVAAWIALRSLLQLMGQHRIRHQYELIAKINQEAEAAAEEQAALAAAEAEAAANASNTTAPEKSDQSRAA